MLNQKQNLKAELEHSAAERERNIDFARFQIEEIEKADFTEAEVGKLNEELKMLTHGEQLIESLTPISQWQSSENSPLSEIARVMGPLEAVQNVAPELKASAEEIRSGLIALQEAAADIDRYLNNLDLDPHRLEVVNERLAELDKLKRKYGATLEDIETFKDEQNEKLHDLEKQDVNYLELEKEIDALIIQVEKQGLEISAARHREKLEFERQVLTILKELGLERSLFEVEVAALSIDGEGRQTFSMNGMDRVEFLITTNPGNPLKPLAKVASGGELSRIMLAIKATLSEDISHGTMVFDEIDQGISGRVAEIVGFKLKKLGESRQIVCITHSPQIASRANVHFRVEKQFLGETSKTFINRLAQNERVAEIARFLGGNKISEKTISAAREMLAVKSDSSPRS